MLNYLSLLNNNKNGKLSLKKCIILLLIGLVMLQGTNTMEEKCFNQTSYEWTRNQKDDFLFPFGGINFNKGNDIKYGDKVQILSKHVYLDKSYKFFERSLIYKGNSTTWKMSAIGAIFLPAEKKINCQEKLKCNKEDTTTKSCNKCDWKGTIISDMSSCVKNLETYKGDPVKFNDLCLNYTSIPTPKGSAFRNFSSYEKWDFDIISPFSLSVVDSDKLDDCEKLDPLIQNFICYDATSDNPDRATFYKFNYNGDFVQGDKLASGILGQNGLFEDNYNTLKMFSPSKISIDNKDYYVVDYNGLNWMNSAYFTDCSKINPVGPSPIDPSSVDPKPNPPSPNPDPSSLSGFLIFLIIFASLAALVAIGYGVYYIKRKKITQISLLD